jgi:hypothetical protein
MHKNPLETIAVERLCGHCTGTPRRLPVFSGTSWHSLNFELSSQKGVTE